MPKNGIDPVTFEILSNRLVAINDETGETLQQVSGSPVANQFFDMNTSLMDKDGQVVVVGNYLAFHTVSLDRVVKRVIETLSEFPGIDDGDMFICNNPYDGAQHQSDVVLVAPIFIDGELTAWVGGSVHQADVGGPVPGQAAVGATSIYEEEIPMSPIKIVEGGRMRPDLEREYLIRSRTPELVAVDLMAMVAANRRAVERLRALAERYTRETVVEVIEAVIDDTETSFRARLEELPDSVINRRAYMDYEGDMYEVWLKLTKRGDSLRFDFDASKQAPGVVNCAEGALFGGVVNAVLTYICGGELPWCPAGVLRAIEINVPKGTFINAEWPAGVSAATTGGMLVGHTASSAVVCQLVDAADLERPRPLGLGSGGLGVVELSGVDQTGAPFAMPVLDGAVSGGLGATPDHDGVDAGSHSFTPHAGIGNVEDFEFRYPILYHRREFVTDSGGAGRYRGGRTISLTISPHDVPELDDVIVHGFGRGPLSVGLSGGMPGAAYSRRFLAEDAIPGGVVSVEEAEGAPDVPEFWRSPWKRGEVYWTIGSGGGGGYGDPLDRDPEAIALDVLYGAVSPETALEVYGTVIADGKVDAEATAERRAEIRKGRLERSAPPSAGDLAESPSWGSVSGRLSDALTVRDGSLACARCESDLGKLEGNYKALLKHERIHAHDLGRNFGPEDSEFELRLFYCPECGHQATNEVALVEEPIEEDIHLVAASR